MCEHTNATITVRHQVDRTFNAAGEQLGGDRLLPDGTLATHCPDCGALVTGSATATGSLPRWVVERLAALPVIR